MRVLLSAARGFTAHSLAALLLTGQPGAPQAANPPPPPAGVKKVDTKEVILRGRVVCLAEEMHRLHDTELSTGHPHLFGFRDASGRYYTLLRTRFAEALFADARVRDLELVLKAHLLPNSDLLDVARFFGVRDGKLLEVYYFCALCVIQGPAPGPCPCCQDDLELTITPTGEAVPAALGL